MKCVPNDDKFIIGAGNGLVFIRQEAITWIIINQAL